MASAASGLLGAIGSSSYSSIRVRKGKKKEKASKNTKLFCSVSASFSVMDPYKTLRIQPGASEFEVKKAFRKLALQFHPDVCRMNDCELQFCQINEAYNIVMNDMRCEPTPSEAYESYDQNIDQHTRETEDPDCELWEEWMGWDGAGIRDYTSHINNYI